MDNGIRKVCWKKAKQIDIVDYLAAIGYHPCKIINDDYWYCSPLREEKTASFKVYRKSNVWYDHGLGQGGTFIDFVILFYRCSVRELFEKLSSDFSFRQHNLKVNTPFVPQIKINAERPLSSLWLLHYLRQRRISEDVAQKYCREISFTLNEKTYSAIGFRNNKGGYELRNEWFKGGSSPKAITSIENGCKDLAVFEGFFDFLSYQTIAYNQQFLPSDFLILNSVSFFGGSRILMEYHQSIRLFLDHDPTGQQLTQQALLWSKKYSDESNLYKGYKDLNEWVSQIGKSKTKGLHSAGS